ncbi:MAG: uroporphyrinogen-III C-methyltransferase [Armatimonadetes bacterium CG2_30_59_28]|nr:uroporphyrinogen-III C-methyltransferase [Armatimonadota bacterium]OIO90911.1 MAG: uroporphyrinogen-III C-methyltransferase [Armatimonadetes bacterium CG2_30_59_28]PIU64210.1 MAG: uroporphyrinogen-III C-methyltransferase [Armatimonadetes bacterium CG07_land_8_20_14_0_80_59_28]PIY48107.1 MAG: uroporphyrinogen-III C-methyltransferase [Armatimonadetes bacterium CG_4_10_14_3_um_filter_59_10]PJB77974.1 MAG: uroporphyrinogen-III C-methyltransferase [Armatimonadetes bacterium CG_4_9_14_3_um_filter_
MSPSVTGTVYIVGAGPGDPGLITVKGLECLQRCPAVAYDRLVSSQILDLIPPDTERRFVGKAAQRHKVSQDEINQMLVNLAREGKDVCRLKGGDPFVFGRGGEEAEALAAAHVPFVIVPGVTSATAVPAYAGIPLTHRRHASSVTILTGHEDPDKDYPALHWDRIATSADTIVCLMTVGHLRNVAERLVRHGRLPQTPAAVIHWGTTPDQQTITGELSTISALVQDAEMDPPALLVAGDVVRLRDTLRWFDKSPLFGKRVVVTRARQQAADFVAKLESLGAEIIEFPVIKIADLESYEMVDTALSYLREYHWIIFTSANGVDAFFRRLYQHGAASASPLEKLKVCAIGPATARQCAAYGLRVDLVPEKFIAESVAEALRACGIEGKRVLLPRAQEAREILPQMLEECGAQVDVVPVYRTVLDEARATGMQDRLRNREIDIITFTSSSTVRNFVKLVGEETVREHMQQVCIACIGPITAKTAEEMGMSVDVVAEKFTAEGLIKAVLVHSGNRLAQRHLTG